MNKYAKDTFNTIKGAAHTYTEAVTRALTTYRSESEAAKQYKDEIGRTEAAKTNARNSIKAAEDTFTATVAAEVETLKGELKRHLVTVPSDKYFAVLDVYAKYGMTPGKSEVAALMEQAAGNSLALRALNAVLDKTKSEWRVNVPDAGDFERDLDALERLAEGHIMFSPQGLHTENSAVFKDTPQLHRNDNGEYVDRGYRWSSPSILTATGDFTSKIAALDGMSERWTQSILPTIYRADVYKGHVDKDGNEITGAEEFVEDYHATATAGEIVKNPDAETERASEQGKARAQADAKAREIVDMYAGARS